VGHTIPTDHVYFWYSNPNNTTYLPVYALAPGKVEKILNVPVLGIKEVKVWFRVNEKFSYYLDHIVLDPSIQEGSSVKSGQQIGTTGLGQSIGPRRY
jgi:murein DD-endopeptidase MepM/ murein hydrolase activator NlpD